MKIKSAEQVVIGAKVDKQRRTLLKLAAAGSASAIASPWMFQSSRAAPRIVKIGMVSPETGPIAAFGEADKFVLAGVRKALGDGIIVAGEKHPVEIIYKDSQSNPNRAAEVTAQLINNDKVDLVIGSSTSDTVIPVSDQCELAGVPCVTSDDPWQVSSRQKATRRRDLNGPIISSGARSARQRICRHVAVAPDRQGSRHAVEQRRRR